MNDPLENRELTFSGTLPLDGKPEELVFEELTDMMDKAQFRLRRIRNRMLLLCFTVDATTGYGARHEPFMRAWARPRMWDQYGHKHEGVCIVFDRAKALGHLRAELNALGSPTLGQVVYTPSGFGGTEAANLELARFRHDESGLARWVVEREADLFFTKTLDWQTEHEFRVTLFPRETSDEGYVFVPFGGRESVRAVILGEHFPQARVAGAEAICQRAGVELLIAIWTHGRPRLVPSAWSLHRLPGGGFSEPLGPDDVLDPDGPEPDTERP
jgi:hypothetical protein